MESLGICVGASTISMVQLSDSSDHRAKIVTAVAEPHEGDSRGKLLSMLADMGNLSGVNVAATGRKFRALLNLPSISEPEAVEYAVQHALPSDHGIRTVISAGGETFIVYHLDETGRVAGVHTGNKCASGTGEFLLQQLGRMDLTLESMGALEHNDECHPVSGRCSVFCKSDCTHALNKGVPKNQVVGGLARMMAGKCLELIKKLPKNKVLLTGGCSKNRFMVHHLENEVGELIIPDEAPWFEALGAALWAMEQDLPPFPGPEHIIREKRSSFPALRPLSEFTHMVDFKEHPRGTAQAGDEVIVGLDVGSTTTKGVVMRTSDNAVLASEYLRTNGDPVGASRRVYRSLSKDLSGELDKPVEIIGLGVTGSGRAIAGLHAGTEGVINEIIAHATAAAHYDPAVDTIFEIGGQDAKYTSLTNSVADDYAMNEACSAGTGSFLEEAAKETLGVEVTEIGDIALNATHPPNFNDQCAAFISSDIKIAIQEGIGLPDILAGLVYSVCMNYANRVKGARAVGNTVFMQGGVCCNPAVPVAMAALTGKHIVVPPDPGLMGAFGVALEVKHRMDAGLLTPSSFDLDVLAEREVTRKPSFICNGGKEHCDRGCEISRIVVDGRTFPFGGICNRWENLRRGRETDCDGFDLADLRRKRIFRDLAPEPEHGTSTDIRPTDNRPTIGLNRSFLINTYFPLFNTFFDRLGFRTVLPDTPTPEGRGRRGAPFCFPGELAHGFMADLLKKNPDYLFMPHIRSVPRDSPHMEPGDHGVAATCVLVQGEPYYVRSAFPEIRELNGRAFSQVFNFAGGIESAEDEFIAVGKKLGASSKKSRAAFRAAVEEQDRVRADLLEMGRKMLRDLENDPDGSGVVLFGRPYNSCAPEANKGIPPKFATRGVRVIPMDMLPLDKEVVPADMNMYWGLGRMMLKAARFTKKHPKLHGCLVTNFSCGPDSFLAGYFRDTMGKKPSLTLELDSHTADAGLETRIEAFLDIVRNSRAGKSPASPLPDYRPARMESRERGGVPETGITDSSGTWYPIKHERVVMALPTMNPYVSRLVCKAFNDSGIRAVVVPPADEEGLKIGRGNSTCKECLPLQLTVGSYFKYLQTKPKDEISIWFMPSAVGPCRFGQYNVFTRRMIEKNRIPDATVFATCSTEGYGALGSSLTLNAWRGLTLGDLFEEMHATILAGAKDPKQGIISLNRELANIEAVLTDWKKLTRQLKKSAKALSLIQLKKPYEEIPKLSLVGEIFVRHDPLARQGIIERMAEKGFIVRTSQITEWMKYTDWLIRHKIEGEPDKGYWLKLAIKTWNDRMIRHLLSKSGLFFHHGEPLGKVIKAGKQYISPMLSGEAILTVGAAFHDILHPSCGILSLGPFGCMPSRVAEAVLSEQLTTHEVAAAGCNGHFPHIFQKNTKLPFLAVETDGNPFPQIIEARLEAFCLQAGRLHEEMRGE